MRIKISVSAAIKKAEESARGWHEAEAKGKAYGFAQFHERMAKELKRFKTDLEKNKDNPAYVCKNMSGYIDVLQNDLFHAKLIVTDEKIKRRLDKVHNELAILFYLLDGIGIVS